MRRTTLAALILVSATASVAFGLARRAEWSGMAMGKAPATFHAMVSMKAGKEPNTTEVTVSTMGDTPNTTRPWHIHMGSCAKAGAPFGGGKNYTPIAGDAKGAGSTKATLPVALPDTGSYYLNVHESSTAMANIVACGDLKYAK